MLYSTPEQQAMTDGAHEPDADDRRMMRIYRLVLVVEVAVIAALWSFSHYFG
jgi:hypothetical protein